MFKPVETSSDSFAIVSVGIDLKELGGGSAAKMFEILPRD